MVTVPLLTTALSCGTLAVGYTLVGDDNQAARGTTVLGLSSSFSSAVAMGIEEKEQQAIAANQYIESLSDEQLIELENKLTEKEEVLTSIEENIKVH